MRSSVAAVAVTALLSISSAQAEISDSVVRIGVLNDQSSLYADAAGPGSVLAAQMALEDFGSVGPGIKVEMVSADHRRRRRGRNPRCAEFRGGTGGQ
jgi:branched-chain amino acid transport system substrate-binding protein